jgi:hypothetical protein
MPAMFVKIQYKVFSYIHLKAIEYTAFLKRSPSWEFDSGSEGQEISYILWSPKVQYYLCKRPVLKLSHLKLQK